MCINKSLPQLGIIWTICPHIEQHIQELMDVGFHLQLSWLERSTTIKYHIPLQVHTRSSFFYSKISKFVFLLLFFLQLSFLPSLSSSSLFPSHSLFVTHFSLILTLASFTSIPQALPSSTGSRKFKFQDLTKKMT